MVGHGRFLPGRCRRYRSCGAGYPVVVTIDGATARRLLEEERERLEEALAAVRRDLEDDLDATSGELSSYDQHQAERGTEVAAEEQDIGLRRDLRVRLEENAEALRRLDEGRYGTCERCGRPIDDERLRAMPSTRYCRDDQLALAAL